MTFGIDQGYEMFWECGEKSIWFKPGAEKIATLCRLRESLSLERLEAIEVSTGEELGKPL
ncbi:MAG: hypothetical protein AAGH78_11315 [Cyanobacteria bacterium P01_H01_bin.58]